MPQALKGKTAVVTGAGQRGIGRSIAIALAREGERCDMFPYEGCLRDNHTNDRIIWRQMHPRAR